MTIACSLAGLPARGGRSDRASLVRQRPGASPPHAWAASSKRCARVAQPADRDRRTSATASRLRSGRRAAPPRRRRPRSARPAAAPDAGQRRRSRAPACRRSRPHRRHRRVRASRSSRSASSSSPSASSSRVCAGADMRRRARPGGRGRAAAPARSALSIRMSAVRGPRPSRHRAKEVTAA